MTSEMVERVSRFICDFAGYDPDRSVRNSLLIDALGSRPAWRDYEDTAREFIGLLREPSDEMVNAGMDMGIVPVCYEEARSRYQAMIAAALK